MKSKLMGLFLVLISFFSCNQRCTEAMGEARGQKRDTALCYLWRYANSNLTTSIDSGYRNYKNNGDYEDAYTQKELKYSSKFVWSSSNGSYTYVGCQDNGSTFSSTCKYKIKGDSLTINYSNGEQVRYIKVSKPIP
jgi:hypothetical protein